MTEAFPNDRRLRAARPDLADIRLRGEVDAERFVAPSAMQVAVASIPLRGRSDDEAGVDTELLYGEPVEVFEIARGWAWLRSERDGYVGYARAAALKDRGPDATHVVTTRATHLYPETGTADAPATSMKPPPILRLTYGARVSVVGSAIPLSGATGEALPVAGGGYIYAAHVTPIDCSLGDHAAVAERLLGTPYLWGGRSGDGLDCSALVQFGLEAVGKACPRDTDMQEGNVDGVEPVGSAIAGDTLERGDLVFWPGHVGIMLDEARLLHANAHHMAVAIEPLAETVARLEAGSTFVSSYRRP